MSDAQNELVPGNWQKGCRRLLSEQVEMVRKRHRSGFRLLPFESTVHELTQLLDRYDVHFHAQRTPPRRGKADEALQS